MNNSGELKEKLLAKLPKREKPVTAEPAQEQEVSSGLSFKSILQMFIVVIYRLRSVFLAIPVVVAALRLAAYNSEHLPLMVGIDLQTTGEFAHMISRQSAVMYPMFFTGACLVLVFLSRKPMFPWLISIFSLTIPVLLLVTNMLG